VGRGGAEFPTHLKWNFVKKAKGSKKYVICNSSEGEMGCFKDEFILEHYIDRVFDGLRLAMDYLETKYGYFNINENYYHEFKTAIKEKVKEYKQKGYTIKIFEEHPSYIGGEETALLNAIEGKRVQPRLKPPYPASKGLFGKPTLIHNVETLYDVSIVDKGEYEHKRFFSIKGPVKNPGVYHFPNDWTIEKVLKETKNAPPFEYFAQIGGSASGPVFHMDQLKNEKMTGAGSIEIYRMDTPPKEMLLKWFEFYSQQSCGKCTPCREGTYQLEKMVKKSKEIPWKEIDEVLEVMDTSFCALGKSVPVAVESYRKNVLQI
jgi:NADH:ubiquinone oxidoreductase subunit F (NADH-binding)